MSAVEDIENKTGHAPAMKVGGVRHTQRLKGNDDRPRRDSEKGEADQIVARSPLKPPTQASPVAGNMDKDYPIAAVKHTHEKPVPTHAPNHAGGPAIIQQPRK